MDDTEKRELYYEWVERLFLGPGSEMDKPQKKNHRREVLSDRPLYRYFTGIIYPKHFNESSVRRLAEEDEEAPEQEPEETEETIATANNDTASASTSQVERSENSDDEEAMAARYRRHHPRMMGITCCIGPGTEKLKVTVQAATYYRLNSYEDIREEIDEHLWGAFTTAVDSLSPTEEDKVTKDDIAAFKQLIGFDARKNVMFLNQSINSTHREVYRMVTEHLKKKKGEGNTHERLNNVLYKVFKQTRFQRVPLKCAFEIPIPALDGKAFEHREHNIIWEIIDESPGDKRHKLPKAVLHQKTFQVEDKRYVKFILENQTQLESTSQTDSSNTSLGQDVDEKSLFQNEILVEGDLLPLRSVNERNPFDDEKSEINFLHRNKLTFALGNGCSADWAKPNDGGQVDRVKTTYLPRVRPAPLEHVTEGRFDNALDALDMWKLSIFNPTPPEEDILPALQRVIDSYKQWIEEEKATAQRDSTEENNTEAAARIKQRLDSTLARLQRSLDLLRSDAALLHSFRLAHTAMYIQFILQIDEHYARDGREPFEAQKDADYLDANSWAYFKEFAQKAEKPLRYRPFQIAFILLNVAGLLGEDEESMKDRQLVDLLWFPTGGGKTEAYLAIIALTLIHRRHRAIQQGQPQKANGVAVIMRYTLRLLTKQQFERATRLMYVLEYLRNQPSEQLGGRSLGEKPFKIGMWVGGKSTPNKLNSAHENHPDSAIEVCTRIQDSLKQYREQSESNQEETKDLEEHLHKARRENKFGLHQCQWCGSELIGLANNQKGNKVPMTGFTANGNSFKVSCINDACFFSYNPLSPEKLLIPVDVVDDSLYSNPPDVLFGTVDKFAQLAHKPEAGDFLRAPTDDHWPPELIVQDELHLLSGPLGSIAGLYERLFLHLMKREDGQGPKIIASTATARNVQQQVNGLYGREALQFPPSGAYAEDRFFARENPKKAKRDYVGVIPTGPTASFSHTHLMSILLYARVDLLQKLEQEHQGDLEALSKAIDPYWTHLYYFNSLKDLGRMNATIQDMGYSSTRSLEKRAQVPPTRYHFNARATNWARISELTSRIQSHAVGEELSRLEESIQLIEKDGALDLDITQRHSADLLLATNMISVGLDVSRLNLMLAYGLPRNNAEYIQATSRVARKSPGIVFTLLSPLRAREKSMFEQFKAYHQAYYRYVEPLSVTPFTPQTFDRALASLLITYVRHYLGKRQNEDAQFIADIEEKKINALLDEIMPADDKHISEQTRRHAREKLQKLLDAWKSRASDYAGSEEEKQLVYKKYKKHPFLIQTEPQKDFFVLNSMRDVDRPGLVRIDPKFEPTEEETETSTN